jgi:cardiolipin synthase
MDAPARLSDREAALLDQAFMRAAGAPVVEGNSVRILRDAGENYPAWLGAIRGATRRIYFENYFIAEDDVGAEFAAALGERARAGVRVRLVYDWLGSLRRASRQFWRTMSDAGVEIRCFNRPRLLTPVEALHRDHRKAMAVDGRVGYVSGLCVGKMWCGDPARGREPWRDTGIEVRGPAVHDIERAFAEVWDGTGEPLPAGEIPARETMVPAGEMAVRIVAGKPGRSGVFRLDQLIAAAARRRLWITDAYFAGISPYVQALRIAARDGVDVRLLVPGASDIPTLRPLTQAGYRPLLEAHVRVFEWNGPMLHAKSAVADGRWARVGSSNLNIASWINNYELDAMVEDEGFAADMERMYLADLGRATEIVLQPRRRGLPRLRPAGKAPAVRERLRMSGSASRAAAGALRLGRTVGAALGPERVLEPSDARFIAVAGAIALGIAVVGVAWPLVLAVPLALILLWLGVALLARAADVRRERRAHGLPATRIAREGDGGEAQQENPGP